MSLMSMPVQIELEESADVEVTAGLDGRILQASTVGRLVAIVD